MIILVGKRIFSTPYSATFAANVSAKLKPCLRSKADFMQDVYLSMDELFKPFAVLKSSMPIRTMEFMHNMFVIWIKFYHLCAICKLHMIIYSNGKVSSLTPLKM